MNKYFPISLAMMLAAAALLTGAVEASNTNLKTTVTKSVGTKNGKNTPAPLVLDTKKGNVTIDVTKKGPKLDPKVTTTPLDLGKKGPKLEVLATSRLDDKTDASLALVGKDLFVRGHQYLYCICED